MEEEITNRGFNIIKFIDRYDHKCSLQKSSIATEDCIWFGIDDPDPKIMASKVMENGVGWVKYPIHPEVLISTRMHLNQDMIKELLPYLIKFAETGELK